MAAARVAASPRDPFDFFRPLIGLTAAERAKLETREVVARVLPARDHELSVFAATRINAGPAALIAWTQAIETLKAGRYVPAIRRFSNPPAIQDLDALTLDNADLESLRRCRPGDCAVKLTDAEIEAVRVAIAKAGNDWRMAAQQTFKRIVLERVLDDQPVPLAELLPGLPPVSGDIVDAFYYWSKEQYGAGKPVIAVTAVQIVRPHSPQAPALMVVNRQVYASHYRNASVGMSALLAAPDGGHYLVYLNSSQLDLFGGFFGGLRRKLIEGRFRSEAASTIVSTRARLEGPPPEAVTAPGTAAGRQP